MGIMGYVGLILSHNIIALLFTIFLGLTGVIGGIGGIRRIRGMRKIREKIAWMIMSVVFAFGISSFFWLPALAEKYYTSVDQVITTEGSDYHKHFLYIDQLWDSPWGFAGSAPGREDGMSFKIGKLDILLGVLGVLGIVGAFREKKKKRFSESLAMWMGIVLLGLSIFMTLESSVIIWDAFSSFMAYIQFPWRFLVFILFFISLYAGGIVALGKNQTMLFIITAVITISVVYVNLKYFNPQAYYHISQSEYESEYYIKWQISKISDEYLPMIFILPKSEFEIPHSKFDIESGVVENQVIKTDEQSATIIVDKTSQLLINTAYFPGWRVFIDDQEVSPTIIEGKMQIFVPQGQHVIRLLFTNTAVRSLANAISVISSIILFGTIIWLYKNRYEKNDVR